MHLEDLALIGNCQVSALIERTGDIVWSCMPRFDSEPIFSSLLDEREGGHFRVCGPRGEPGIASYLANTNVLQTVFRSPEGVFRVLDFAPRFLQYDRVFRPTQLVRIVEPVEGMPLVEVQCSPTLGWSKRRPTRLDGSNHIQFEGFGSHLRLTTDFPIAHMNGKPVALTERRHLVLSWGPPVEEPLAALCSRFLGATVRYWERWVKQCNIPPAYQDEVIRSALVLKLHCYEDTGAIVAAMTTSIPESKGSGRTWDYRYCWLRDAYYSLEGLRLLGQFEERERFVTYLLGVAAAHPTLDLCPLYRVDGTANLDEQVMTEWPGFNGEGPVRVGNGAVTHRQNDVYGEMVLALAPVFLDQRFRDEQSPAVLSLVEALARKAIAVTGKPDAGIWEYRTEWKPQTFSSAMCWAAADRMARIASTHLPGKEAEFRAAADRIRDEIAAQCWSEKAKAFASTYGGEDLDASLLEMVTLRVFPASDQRIHQTVDAIRDGLQRDGLLQRYRTDDGFGRPTVAFLICTFWWIEALAACGRTDEARGVMDRARRVLSPLGLLAEDYEPSSSRLWGNFPQAYSHVGLIHAAFAASPRWSEVL